MLGADKTVVGTCSSRFMSLHFVASQRWTILKCMLQLMEHIPYDRRHNCFGFVSYVSGFRIMHDFAISRMSLISGPAAIWALRTSRATLSLHKPGENF